MNGDDELPSDYFWASSEAEQEYYAVGQAIAEAEEKLAMARGRMLAASAIADAFPHALNVSSKHHGYSYVYAPSPDNCLPKDYDPLNHALNPYWLWPNGKVEHYGYEPFSAVSFRGSMTLQKIESKTVHAGVGFGRRKKRSGDYVHCTIEYSYEKRVEWYTPTGDAAMSGLEYALRGISCPFDVPGEHLEGNADFEGYGELLLADCLKQETEAVRRYTRSLYDKLLEELIQEVQAFTAPLSTHVVLKFMPNLAPTNIEEIGSSHGEYKKDVPKLEWPPLAQYERPHVGKQYGADFYAYICWPEYGRWETYHFPLDVLNAWRDGTRERLLEQIKAAVREVAYLKRGVLPSLQTQKERIRLLHYKPNEYKVFWFLVGSSVMLPERSSAETNEA